MSIPAFSLSARDAALHALVDYAGLFPPAALTMKPAVDEYLAARSGAYAAMLARFIVPASRLDELLSELPGAPNPPLAVSVIVDARASSAQWITAVQRLLDELAGLRKGEPRLRLEALEVPLPSPASARDTFDAPIGQFSVLRERAGLADVPAFVEVPRDDRWEVTLPYACAALRRYRLSAKLRCGGTTADAFPTVQQAAAFIGACVGEGVAFKATAGLHHPLRGADPTGRFAMHGFINLIAAAALAMRGEAADALEAALADENPGHFSLAESFAWNDRTFEADELRRVRARGLTSYGSCSFSEPVDDLIGMNVLERR